MEQSKIFKLWWLFILTPFGIVFTSIIYTLIFALHIENLPLTLGFSQQRTFALFVYVVGTGIAVFILYYLLKNRGYGWREIGFRGKITGQGIVYAFIAFLVAISFYWIFSLVLKKMGIDMYWGNERQMPLDSTGNIDIIYAFIASVILAPLTEDTIFRGYLYQMFAERYNKWLAIALATIIFSLVHLPFFGLGLTIYMIFWTLISLFLFIKFDNLYIPMIFHAINNLFAYILLPLMA